MRFQRISIAVFCIAAASSMGQLRPTTATAAEAAGTPADAIAVTPTLLSLTATGPDPDPQVTGEARVDNSTDHPVTVSAVAVSRPFEVISDDCTGRQLAPGSSCSLEVAWSVDAGGNVGALVLDTSDGPVSSAVLGEWNAMPATCFSGCPPPAEALADNVVPQVMNLYDACENLAKGVRISYPQQVTMGVGENVPVKVTATAASGAPPAAVAATDPTQAAVNLDLSCNVKARLYNQDVAISPSQDWQEDSFLGDPTVDWLWMVESDRAGAQDVILEIQSTPVVGGTPLSSHGVLLQPLKISVSAPEESAAEKATGFFQSIVDYPLISGFGSLAAVAAAGFGATRWLKSRQKSGPPPSDPA